MATRIYIATSFVVDETYQEEMIYQSLLDYIYTRYPNNDPRIVNLGSLSLAECSPVSRSLQVDVA